MKLEDSLTQVNCLLQYNKVLASPTKASELKHSWTMPSIISQPNWQTLEKNPSCLQCMIC